MSTSQPLLKVDAAIFRFTLSHLSEDMLGGILGQSLLICVESV